MFLLRPLRAVASRKVRYYAAVALKENTRPTLESVYALEQENSRLLRVVQKRVDERARLQSELSEEMSSPEDVARLRQLKETENLENAWTLWQRTREQLEETSALFDDPDASMRSLAMEEANSLSETLSDIVQNTFPSLLIPSSTTAKLSALMELKSGVGGSEASLFLADLLRMYQRLANNTNWKASIVAKNDTEGGGIKDAVIEFKGEGAYDALRWESGVHRVQRVPATEASGRTHTSTVAIVPGGTLSGSILGLVLLDCYATLLAPLCQFPPGSPVVLPPAPPEAHPECSLPRSEGECSCVTCNAHLGPRGTAKGPSSSKRCELKAIHWWSRGWVVSDETAGRGKP
ncbi:hypothetical protein NLJ89_g8564 [Agrocybe chaxingu]|uniref:Peptide chain release factor domain-containing protein n=1 Tax=Agrocybe chaxingu TaxID=84603 RepID=A0A9W8JU65_9AGAR|nr:hypothetical protein NLJ89_g8564 [Agrocybe chaxingu]